MRSFAPLACILILSLPQIAITAPVDQRALIVPGQSVGTLRLKTPLNAVVNAWGPYDALVRATPDLTVRGRTVVCNDLGLVAWGSGDVIVEIPAPPR